MPRGAARAVNAASGGVLRCARKGGGSFDRTAPITLTVIGVGIPAFVAIHSRHSVLR
jgi:hypothetical protein